jgi:hypothetical protein
MNKTAKQISAVSFKLLTRKSPPLPDNRIDAMSPAVIRQLVRVNAHACVRSCARDRNCVIKDAMRPYA